MSACFRSFGSEVVWWFRFKEAFGSIVFACRCCFVVWSFEECFCLSPFRVSLVGCDLVGGFPQIHRLVVAYYRLFYRLKVKTKAFVYH